MNKIDDAMELAVAEVKRLHFREGLPLWKSTERAANKFKVNLGKLISNFMAAMKQGK